MEKERLIINGVDFDHIMDTERIIIHTRIEDRWAEQQAMDDRKYRFELFRELGILLTTPKFLKTGEL
jgi:hypothetical protein